jgi:hypothetical protein
LSLGSGGSAHAITVDITGPVELEKDGNCTASDPTIFHLPGKVTATDDDELGRDVWVIYLIDANNVVIDAVSWRFEVGSVYDAAYVSVFFTSITRPFKFTFVDSNSFDAVVAVGDVLFDDIMHQHTVEFDPADLDPDCAIYPLKGEAEAEATGPALMSFLETRGILLLDRDMGKDRRIDRLSGNAPSVPADPGAAIFNYAAGLTDGSVPVSGSLAAFDALAGNEKERRFDIWFDSTFALFERAGSDGHFSTGTIGADYLVTDALLVGAFVSVDQLTQLGLPFANEISGLGWLAGPYATVRLGDNLYLDMLAGGGFASNSIDTGLGAPDHFDSSRWLVNASLQGDWGNDTWRFAPRLGLSYFEETSEAYTDGNGFAIPSVTVGMGRFAAGPGLTHSATGEDGTRRDISVRLDAVQLFMPQSTSLSARAEAGIDWQTSNGLSFGASTSYSGLGSADHSLGASVKASAGF